MATYIYCRVSPKPDGKADPADSLDTQESACREYCQRAKLELTAAFRDSEVSARKTKLADRPAGAALLAAIKPRDTIICYRLDRVFRDLSDGADTLKAWIKPAISLHSASGQVYSLESPDGWLNAMMQLLLAAHEPILTAHRTSKAMLRYQANGRSMGSRAPYGYSSINGKLIPKPTEQAVLQRISQLDETFPGSPLINDMASTIADVLNDEGVSMRSGKQWTAYHVARLLRRQAAH